MKILIITTHLNIGGIASYTDNLAKTLKEKGEDVFVASSGGDLVERLEEAGVSHKRVNIKTKCEVNPKLIRVIIDLVKFVRENKIDIIHAQTRVAQVVSFFIMKFTKVPYVSTCHGFFKRRLSRCIFPAWGSRVIAISDAVRENLVNVFKVKKERIKIVYNGVDISYLEKQFPQSELDQIKNDFGFINKIVIATVARLSPVKGIGYLVDAAKLLLKERDDVAFLIIGDGPEKDMLKKKVEDYGIAPSIKFIDAIVDTRLYLGITNIFVLSSVQEGLGLSLIEAMACNRPVIATEVGGINTLIKNEETGLLVKPESPEALKAAITRLLEDEALANRLSESAKGYIVENFSISQMTDKTLILYNEARER